MRVTTTIQLPFRFGTYRYTFMQFGLHNAPATLQYAMNIILPGVVWKRWLVCIGVVFIFSMNNRQHLKDINKVQKQLRQGEVTLKLPKSHFFQMKIELPDHLLMAGWLAAASENVDVFRTAIFPTDSAQTLSFWAHVWSTEELSKKFSSCARPLNDYLWNN